MTEKTTQQKLDDLKNEIGQLFFESGRARQEMLGWQQKQDALDIRFRNLNIDAERLTKALQKEGLELKLANPPSPPPPLEPVPAMEGDIR